MKYNVKRISLLVLCMVFAMCMSAGCGKDTSDDAVGTTTENTTQYKPEEKPQPQTTPATAQDASMADEDGFISRDDYVITTSDYVNVRTAPEADAPIYRIVEKGEVLKRTGDSADWTRVIIDNTPFYVYSEYVEVTAATVSGNADNPGQDGSDAPAVSSRKKIVVIDPGNQANPNFETEPIGPDSEETKQCATSGNVGIALGTKEYAINLIYADLLRTELESRGYTVKLTRESDAINMSNVERAQYANASDATVLIRIQMNYSSDISMTGAMTICMKNDSPYNSDLYNESYELSTRILQGITQTTDAVNHGIYETDRLTLVNWSRIPVSVVKIGYLSNVEEEANLNNEDYQKKIVEGIANGLDYYFSN